MKYIIIIPIFSFILCACSIVTEKVIQDDSVAHNVDEVIHISDEEKHKINESNGETATFTDKLGHKVDQVIHTVDDVAHAVVSPEFKKE